MTNKHFAGNLCIPGFVRAHQAETIAANAPLAVRYSKSVMKQAAEVSEAEGWKINGAAVRVVFSSADAMEGPIAFAEKRAPNWQGK